MQTKTEIPPVDSLNLYAELGLRKVGYSIAELTEILPIGRSSVYGAIKSGELEAVKWNDRTIVLAPSIAKFLNKRRQQKAA